MTVSGPVISHRQLGAGKGGLITTEPETKSEGDATPTTGPPDGKTTPTTATLAPIWQALAIGQNFVGEFLAGLILGYLIDRWLDSLPVATLLGCGFGGLLAFIHLIVALKKMERDSQL